MHLTMHFPILVLALVGLVTFAEAAKVVRRSSPISTGGLTVNEAGWHQYCNTLIGNWAVEEKSYVCFKSTSGDIRRTMYDPMNLAGFMNNAGDQFVVFRRPLTPALPGQIFRIGQKSVIISPPAKPRNPNCLGWSITQPGTHYLGAEFCPGNAPVVV